jgi:hypothetical protein
VNLFCVHDCILSCSQADPINASLYNGVENPGGNVELESSDNSISIIPNSAEKTVDLIAKATGKVSTGLVTFQDVRAGEFRSSPPIAHGLDVNYVGIVMAVEHKLEQTPSPAVFMGDLEVLDGAFREIPFFPLMVAAYLSNSLEFFIFLRDRRNEEDQTLVTWQVRWWAIPKTLDQPDVTVPPLRPGVVRFPGEFLRFRVMMRPGITVQELASELRVEPSEVQPELDRLRDAGRIRVEGKRLFPQ